MCSPICGSYSLRVIVAWVWICLVGMIRPDRGKRFLRSSKLPGRFQGLPTSSLGAVGSLSPRRSSGLGMEMTTPPPYYVEGRDRVEVYCCFHMSLHCVHRDSYTFTNIV